MPDLPDSRTRLLGAAIDLVRAHGYAATRVEDVCSAAGVTKGSFFHHFESKEDLAVAAAEFWSARASQLFAEAPYVLHPDPLDRLLGYVKFRRQLISGEIAEYSCYAGTTLQETHASHPGIRDACGSCIGDHVAMLTRLVEHALDEYPVPKLRAETLAVHMQAVLQGAFIMAKSTGDKQTAIDCIDHLHRYIELLFTPLPARKRSR